MRLKTAALLFSLGTMGLSLPGFACEPEGGGIENEALQLCISKGRAVREGNVLRLATNEGPVVFADTDCHAGSADACRKHELASVMIERNQFVVRLGLYEGKGYYLIDAATGKTTYLEGFPHFSPDGQRFVVTTGSDPYDSYNQVEVWTLSSDGPLPLWRHTPTHSLQDISYCVEGWMGRDRVALQGMLWNAG